MKAMVLKKLGLFAENQTPLDLVDLPVPVPGNDEILVKVSVCGVCHTELDEIEGRSAPPVLPVILGHQVVGQVETTGKHVKSFQLGDRVGIAWIYSACRTCEFCLAGNENLCKDFRATGKNANGGYAEYMVIPEHFAVPVPDGLKDTETAPLLCAGAIGYRSLRLTGLKNGQNIGLTGFGASGHLVLKLVRFKYPDAKVFVFARNSVEREFAKELGAVWAGDTAEASPELLDSVIDTTPAWKPVVEAMKNLKPGGRLVINAIRKEEMDKDYLLNLDYPAHLWMEKEIKSVANICRKDVVEFLTLADRFGIRPEVEEFSLEEANQALAALKKATIRGAKVLKIG